MVANSVLPPRAVLYALALCTLAGCGVVPRSRFAALESQHKALTEQNKAQLAEMANLRERSQRLEDDLSEAERELALTDQDKRQADVRRRLPVGMHGRLMDLSRRYQGLEYDPETGTSKLDTDVLFDTGQDLLRDEAKQLLREFVDVFTSAEARQLKMMVVGHADDRLIAKPETREKFATNWHLSTARALAVADFLRKAGLPEERMGVAGFGSQQPLLAERTSDARERNRRVEIFVMGPDSPLVGWTQDRLLRR